MFNKCHEVDRGRRREGDDVNGEKGILSTLTI